MNTATARKIERYARVNGLSFSRAASELASRGARKRQSQKRRTEAAAREQKRFEEMRAKRPDLYC